jgi:hypothetical protein
MNASESLATAHAVLTVLAVLWVLASARQAGPVIAAAAYAAGAEVLWRQTGADVPWEFAKYLVLVIFVVGIVRFAGRLERALLVGVFLAALVPSAVVPVTESGAISALDPLAFNLLGLVVLAMGVLLMRRLAGPWEAVAPVAWSFVAPVIGTATIAAISLRGLGAEDFFNDSNFEAAGGYGPNQVSAILGLGVVLLVLVAVREPQRSLRLVAVGLSLWFLTEALLTFSRGGVLNVVIALLAALPFLVAKRDTGGRIALLLALVVVLGLLLLPSLESLTGGSFGRRFSDTRQSERRAELIEADWETFLDHPVLGVGVGQAELYRLDRLVIASHTEYTRLLAEHGLLGIVAVACLVAMGVGAFRNQRTAFGYAWSAALLAWTATELWHASTRLAAVSVAFALASFTMVEDVTTSRAPR